MSDRVASLSTPALAALLAAACLVVLAGAFAVGRLTAPSGRHAAPALVPVASSGTQLSLPQLSQAVPVPALVTAPPPTQTTATTAPKQVFHQTKPKRAGAPVDITGSG